MRDADERVTRQLILLHLAGELPGLSSDELQDLAIRSMYMDYFSYSVTFDQLISQHYLTESVRKNETSTDINSQPLKRIDITPEGSRILDTLMPTLPQPIRRHLNAIIDEVRGEQARRRESWATVDRDLAGRFYVHLYLNERDYPLLNLELYLPDEDMARRIAANWTGNAEALYPELLECLIKPEQD